jgi:hypothetical protein
LTAPSAVSSTGTAASSAIKAGYGPYQPGITSLEAGGGSRAAGGLAGGGDRLEDGGLAGQAPGVRVG